MWISIQKILPIKLRQLGLEKAFIFRKIQLRWNEITNQSIGPIFNKKSKPISLKKEILSVDCLNSVWANELQMRESAILKKIKKEFKDVKIERIKFRS